MSLILTADNYFSKEASLEYMSVSQYKSFRGTKSQPGCEEHAMAVLRGDWVDEPSPALVAGSYVDSHFEGTLPAFISQHPEIFTKDGKLRSEYQLLEKMIKRAERDDYFMKCMSGEKQKILTGEIFGVQWKGKLDSYIHGKCIVDLKTTRSISENIWASNHGWITFIEHFGYDIQAAVYQKLVEINTGKRLPFLIAAVSKETFPDIEVIGFDQNHLDMKLQGVFLGMSRINEIKSGKTVPTRCGECDYCHATKILRGPVHFMDLINSR